MFLASASIGVKITIWFIGVLGLCLLLNALMIKVLNVNKERLYTYKYENGIHKKVELFLNIIFITTTFVMTINKYPYFLSICIGYAILLYGTRVIFEKKYAENPKEYLYSLCEFGSLMLSLFVMTSLIFPEYLSFK